MSPMRARNARASGTRSARGWAWANTAGIRPSALYEVPDSSHVIRRRHDHLVLGGIPLPDPKQPQHVDGRETVTAFVSPSTTTYPTTPVTCRGSPRDGRFRANLGGNRYGNDP